MKNFNKNFKKKQLNVSKLFLLIVFTLTYFGVNAQYDIIKKAGFKWDGNDNTGLNYVKGHAENYSFSAFEIFDDNVAFLSNQKFQIKIFNKSHPDLNNIIELETFATDFTYSNNKFYVVDDEFGITIFDKQGNLVEKINSKLPQNTIIEQIKVVDGDIFLLSSDEKSYLVSKCHEETEISEYDGWVTYDNFFVETRLENKNEYSINIISNDRIIASKNIKTKKEIGSIEFIGKKGDELFLSIEYILNNSGSKVLREIEALNFNNYIISESDKKIIFPNMYYVNIKKDIIISNNKFYAVISTPEELKLYSISYNKNTSNNKFDESLYSSSYHYNNFTLSNDAIKENNENTTKSTKLESITRTEIISNAYAYYNHVWTASSSNIKRISCGGKIVQNPSWVTVGKNYSFPYCWGGNSSVSSFDYYLTKNRCAGDKKTGYSFGAEPLCTTGVDCSGFVSRVFGLSSHYGTSNMYKVTSEYSSINNLKKGDILLKRGHVMLFESFASNGKINVMEAVGSSGNYKLRRYAHTRTYCSAYKPCYYKEVTNPTPPATSQVFDKFDEDRGHFYKNITYSGTTKGINTSSASVERVTNYPKYGAGALKIIMSDDYNSNENWFVRLLSGRGAPENNAEFTKQGKLKLWLASNTTHDNAKVFLWVDDSDGIEQSKQVTIINDGNYHLYEWDLTNTSDWTAITGNGSITGSKLTLDAVMFSSPNNSPWSAIYIDHVQHIVSSSKSTLNVNNNEDDSNFALYPTIANESINIKIQNNVNIGNNNIEIYEISGKKIKSINIDSFTNNTHKINISNLSKGFYIVKIGSKSLKFIKK